MLLAGICATDLDVAKTHRARAVTGPHHLLGLALSTIRRPPQRPVLRAGDGRAGIPELRGDAAIARILQHADALAVAYLPSDFATELKVIPLVINRPALVGFHVDPAVGAKYFIESLLARFQAHVRHPDQRNPRPTVRPHGAVRAGLPDRCRRLTGRHITDELAVADDIGALRGHAFIIETECTQPRAVVKPCIADDIHDLRAV